MVKIGRNDPCPCGAKDAEGNPIKYKKCCEDIRRAAVSVLSRCQERINAKLIEVLKTRGIKRAHSSCKIDTTGYIYILTILIISKLLQWIIPVCQCK